MTWIAVRRMRSQRTIAGSPYLRVWHPDGPLPAGTVVVWMVDGRQTRHQYIVIEDSRVPQFDRVRLERSAESTTVAVLSC